MKTGRFLPFTFLNMISLAGLLGPCVRSFTEDGGGETFDRLSGDDAASPDTGKAEEAAPDAGKDTSGDDDTGKGETDDKGQESSQEQASEITDDELTAALEVGETPEAKTKRLEREYKASSTEAQRLSKETKAYAKALEAQGLKSIVKDGEVKFVPTDKYNDKAAKFGMKVSNLPIALQEAIESGDPEEAQKALDYVQEQARSAFVRAVPTLDKEPATISDERKATVFNHMETAKDVNDSPIYEKFGINKSHIESFINNPLCSPARREAFAADPEMMAGLVNAQLNVIRARLSKTKADAATALAEAEKSGRERANGSVDGSGTVVAKGGSSSSSYNRFD